jgi:hypothetical protein
VVASAARLSGYHAVNGQAHMLSQINRLAVKAYVRESPTPASGVRLGSPLTCAITGGYRRKSTRHTQLGQIRCRLGRQSSLASAARLPGRESGCRICLLDKLRFNVRDQASDVSARRLYESCIQIRKRQPEFLLDPD